MLWVLMVLAGMPALGQAQYQLFEMAAHAGAGARMLTGSSASVPGPGAHLTYSYTYFPCGKAFGFEGRASLMYAQTALEHGATFLNNPLAGKTTVGWTGGDIGAAFKVRLHEKHRPKEVAFLFGPKISFPALAWYRSEIGNGGIPNADVSLNRLAPAGFFAIQFRRPAPEKKSWFFEPGVEFMPTYLFRRADNFHHGAMYIYFQFGYAFWDQRG